MRSQTAAMRLLPSQLGPEDAPFGAPPKILNFDCKLQKLPAMADSPPVDERLHRSHLRSQAKFQRQEKEERERRKEAKKNADAELLDSVRLLSPFLCGDLELEVQSRLQWAIEWSEHKRLTNLPTALQTIDFRHEIFDHLRTCTKTNALCAYFGISETSYFKYLKQYREKQQSRQRVANLVNQQQVRPATQVAGSSLSHSVSAEILLDTADTTEQPVTIEMRHAGRQVAFSEETLQAAKLEFAARVTGPKRGMTADAMVEMLIRLRQQHQAQPYEFCLGPPKRQSWPRWNNLKQKG
jgi:hypothetical protein